MTLTMPFVGFGFEKVGMHTNENQRQERFRAALRRVRKTGSPAARAELRDTRLDLEAHGETPDPGNEHIE